MHVSEVRILCAVSVKEGVCKQDSWWGECRCFWVHILHIMYECARDCENDPGWDVKPKCSGCEHVSGFVSMGLCVFTVEHGCAFLCLRGWVREGRG